MTATEQPPLPSAQGPGPTSLDGLMLHGVQLIRIARHTSHVLPLMGAGVHVISGQGPGGASNGAGKTSVSACVLLACADPQWTRSNAGAKAIGLLFNERDAQQPEGSHGDAPHGYIVTLWLDPAAPTRTAVTVLTRIHRTHRDHLQVRTRSGKWFAVGATEAERLLDADDQWEHLRGQRTLGPAQYGTTLFGAAPGSVGYVRRRGADDSGDSGLLSVADGRRFSARTLATELINLCGVSDQIELEQRNRRKYADLGAELIAAEADDIQQRIMEDQEKANIQARATAKEYRDRAETEWLAYLAAGLREAAERYEAAHTRQALLREQVEEKRGRLAEYDRVRHSDVAAAAAQRERNARQSKDHAQNAYTQAVVRRTESSTRLSDLDTELAALAPAVATAGTTTAEQATHAAANADEQLLHAQAHHHHLLAACAEAEDELTAAEEGLAGHAGRVSSTLRDLDIAATPLVDLVDLSEAQRTEWEPRLAPLHDVVVIASADHDRTVDALADHPGTQLLVVDTTSSTPRTPDGPGTHPLDPVLAVLAARYPSHASPTGTTPFVSDDALRLTVIGGFDEPQTGRANRVHAARTRLDHLRRALAEAETVLGQVRQEHDDAHHLLSAVRDSLRHTRLTVERAEVDARHQDDLLAVTAAADRLGEAEAELLSAHEELATAAMRREDADKQSARLEKEITVLIDEIDRDDADRHASAADAYRHALGSNLARANNLLGSTSGTVDIRRQRAVADLRRAIEALTDVPPLEDAVRRQDHLAQRLHGLREWCSSPELVSQQPPEPFDTRATALDGWLRAHGTHDADRLQQIETVRDGRAQNLEATRHRIRENQDVATTAVRNAKGIIKTRITSVERQLSALWAQAGRHKIHLHATATEPQTPDEPLIWELGITWQDKHDLPPRRYTDQINTAERVVIHTLLAVAALAAQSNPKGRVIVIDEFGQNLDLRTTTDVAAILNRIALATGLTILLSCQDMFAALTSGHCQTLIEVRRPDERDALNAPPHITVGPQPPEIVRLLGEYWTDGRPIL